MLFGRAPAREKIPLRELGTYLDRCFDGKLKRLSLRLPEVESELSGAFSAFEAALRGFSESENAPNMEYFYNFKENYISSQKASYAASLLHAASTHPEYGGSCLYLKGKNMLDAYSSFVTNIMKVNNSFRLVMLGYAAELTEVKRRFTAIERLCKELGNELALCSIEHTEYKKLESRIGTMVGNLSAIESLERSVGRGDALKSVDEREFEAVKRHVVERQRQLEIAQSGNRDAGYALSGLLLPLERAARKHDHLSPSKRTLTDYIKSPAQTIVMHDDIKAINRHLEVMAEEVRSGKIEAKNPDSLIAQMDSIRDRNLLALADTARRTALELSESEAKLSESHLELKALEKISEERGRVATQKAQKENEIGVKQSTISHEKNELEQLFLSCYKKNIEIML